MRWNNIFINGAAAWLGRKEDVQEAVSDGRYDAEEYKENDYSFVRVAGDERPADMAVEAAALALRRGGADAGTVDLVMHATSGFQGLDHWTAGPYIQARTVGGHAPAFEVKQACNGGLMALDLAAAYINAREAPSAALITTGDKFTGPGYERYSADKNIVLADGATAVVISHTPGVARVLSTVMIADTVYEGLSHGHTWAQAAGSAGPVDLRGRKKQHLISSGDDIMDIVRTLTVRQQESMDQALADADTTVAEIARFVFPNVGRIVQDWELRKSVGIEESRTTWEWGRQIGHIAAGDQFAGLIHLIESGAVRPGDKVALAGVGTGYNFGWAIVEILQEADWEQSTAE